MEEKKNDILYRGTTPTHSFTLPEELKEVELSALYITYRQGGNTVLEKALSDVTVEAGVVTVQLTQEDTLAFQNKGAVQIQIRLRTAAGDALASDIIKVDVGRVLKDGVI